MPYNLVGVHLCKCHVDLGDYTGNTNKVFKMQWIENAINFIDRI